MRSLALRAARRGRSTMPASGAALLDRFEVLKTDELPEYGVGATLYRHRQTGAEILSMAAPHDDNKVFGITFATLPTDDTGVPHILEHSVLCGSRKYPLKEPFVELLKGSLQTFLNAFTMADKTCYPVASQNTQDFYNLVDVYLDAVLFPKLGPSVLKQEGWHVELEATDGPLSYNGVVYNEMKGVYSSPDALHARACQRALFRGHPIYGVDSGGDPPAIPTLTYEAFERFHRTYYHPANSRIFFYGDDALEPRLAKVDEFLRDFGAAPPGAPSVAAAARAIPIARRVGAPYAVQESYAVADDAEEADMRQFVSLNWLLNEEEALTPDDELTWQVLNHLLLGTASSDLERALLESQLGASVVGGGFASHLQQATFGVGLKGVALDNEAGGGGGGEGGGGEGGVGGTSHNVAAVEDLVLGALRRIAVEGFEPAAVEASMNTLEFHLREFNTGSYPRGLSFMLGALNAWSYGRDPTHGLKFEAPLRRLKARLASGEPVFSDLLRAGLLDNPHRATVVLTPDRALGEAQRRAEQASLDAVRAALDTDGLAELVRETAELKAAQAAHDPPEALAAIPTLRLSDLEARASPLPIEVEQRACGTAATILRHELPTAGIVYIDVGLPLFNAPSAAHGSGAAAHGGGGGLPAAALPALPLLCQMLSELGTARHSDVAFSRLLGTHTGGLEASPWVSAMPGGDPAACASYVMLRGKATAAKAAELFDLAGQMLREVQLDERDRVVEMLRDHVASLEASLVSDGSAFAASRVRAQYGAAGAAHEQLSGLEQLHAARAMLAQAEDPTGGSGGGGGGGSGGGWPALLGTLREARDALLRTDGLVLNLTADAASLTAAEPHAAAFLQQLSSSPSSLPGSVAEGGRWPHDDAAAAAHGGGFGWAPRSHAPPPLPLREGLQVPTQVNYVAQGRPVYGAGEAVPGAASVAARHLSSGHLWDTVRVVGGAYGCSLSLDRLSGMALYSSYRDPHLAATLKAYDAAPAALRAPLPPAEMTKAVVGAVGELDTPQTADQKGFTSMARHLLGVTEAERQTWRDRVLATSHADFREFADRLDAVRADGGVCVVGSEEAFAANSDSESDGMPLDVRKVL